jgi:hypothetical protein
MEWIKTIERLPQEETEVIVTNGNYVTIGELANYGQWRVLNGLGIVESTIYLDKNRITHWMPLPGLPD